MKQPLLSALVVCLLAGGLTQIMNAQGRDSARLTLTQEAVVGTMVLPPGEYTITDIADHSGSAMLMLRSSNGFHAALLANRIDEPRHQAVPQSKVLLQHIGDRYELKSVWMQGRDYGFQLLAPQDGEE